MEDDAQGMDGERFLQVGVAVVSRDGVQLGEVQEVGANGVLFGREFGPLLRLPAALFARARTGALRLPFDAADIRIAERRHALMGR